MITDALAVYRLTRMVTKDRIGQAFRDRVVTYVDDGTLPDVAEYLVRCPWCVGVWVSGAVLVVRRMPGWPTVARLLAVSAIAGLLSELA